MAKSQNSAFGANLRTSSRTSANVAPVISGVRKAPIARPSACKSICQL